MHVHRRMWLDIGRDVQGREIANVVLRECASESARGIIRAYVCLSKHAALHDIERVLCGLLILPCWLSEFHRVKHGFKESRKEVWRQRAVVLRERGEAPKADAPLAVAGDAGPHVQLLRLSRRPRRRPCWRHRRVGRPLPPRNPLYPRTRAHRARTTHRVRTAYESWRSPRRPLDAQDFPRPPPPPLSQHLHQRDCASAVATQAALPYWGELQASARAQSLLRGVNAACAGLVIAAVFQLFDHITDSLIQQARGARARAAHAMPAGASGGEGGGGGGGDGG
eukprot:3330592-Pleurochrysis_carterae.AAC.1